MKCQVFFTLVVNPLQLKRTILLYRWLTSNINAVGELAKWYQTLPPTNNTLSDSAAWWLMDAEKKMNPVHNTRAHTIILWWGKIRFRFFYRHQMSLQHNKLLKNHFIKLWQHLTMMWNPNSVFKKNAYIGTKEKFCEYIYVCIYRFYLVCRITHVACTHRRPIVPQ